MESYTYNHPVYGKSVAIVQPIPVESPYIAVAVFVNDSTSYTSLGNLLVPEARLGDQVSQSFAGLQYLSNDLWATKDHAKHEAPKSSFPLFQTVEDEDGNKVLKPMSAKAYNTEHMKVFLREWKQAPRFKQVGRMLGISDKKVLQILKRLRSIGVKVPRKFDEPKPKKRQSFDWKHIVRAIRGAKFIETAVNATGIPLDKLLFLATLAQEAGVKLTIPPFQHQPEWIQIRAKNDMKQIIRIKSPHGSGRNFKEAWARYKRTYKISPESLRGL